MAVNSKMTTLQRLLFWFRPRIRPLDFWLGNAYCRQTDDVNLIIFMGHGLYWQGKVYCRQDNRLCWSDHIHVARSLVLHVLVLLHCRQDRWCWSDHIYEGGSLVLPVLILLHCRQDIWCLSDHIHVARSPGSRQWCDLCCLSEICK